MTETKNNPSKLDKIIEYLDNCTLNDDGSSRAEEEKALNNLIILARDDSPNALFNHPRCKSILKSHFDIGKNQQITKDNKQSIVACFRLLSELCKASIARTTALLEEFTIDYLIDIVSYSNQDDLLTSFQFTIQTIVNALSGTEVALKKAKALDKDRTKCVAEAISQPAPKKRIDDKTVKENEALLLEIFTRLMKRSSSYIISAIVRDRILELIMTNIDYKALNFGQNLVNDGCLDNLLSIASEVEDLRNESSMDITSNTHNLVAAVLDKLYYCHDHDKAREIYRGKVQDFLDRLLRNADVDDKVRATKIFSTLLAGPTEIGNTCIGQAGMIEMILAMANSDELVHQKTALDTIIVASSKKDKSQSLAKLGEKILFSLSESKNEEIRLRALVGLSKISSVSGTDSSIRPFDRQANIDFARECRKILIRPTPEFKLKHWATEAMAYLSLDGDVKTELVNDNDALRALYDIGADKLGNVQSSVYSVLSIFVNLTNSYDKQEQLPELKELAKFAKQHIPEEHSMDSKQYVDERCEKLVQAGLVPALVSMSEVDSKQSRELLSRILNALCELSQSRGLIIQQGGVKLMLNLSQENNTDEGQILACQGLARLGITINPEFVYPGQKMLAVIRPLKRLLDPKCTALQNFEGLMALTNLAQANEDVRRHILRDNGYSLIQSYMFEEHEQLKRAATQCVVNLIRSQEVVSLYEKENDNVKYLVILSQDDDLETAKAASGALAMLCQISEKACSKVFSAKHWYETFMMLLSNKDAEFVHRGMVIVHSIVNCSDTSLAEKIFDTKIFEVLLALTLPQVDDIPQIIKNLALECLKIGKQLKLIRNSSDLSQVNEVDEDV